MRFVVFYLLDIGYLSLNTVLMFSHSVVALWLHNKINKFECLPDSKVVFDRSNLNSLGIADYFVH